MTSHRDRRFAGRQNAGGRLDRISTSGNLTSDGGKESADVFRFAFNFGSENESVEIHFPGLAGGGIN